VIANDPACRRLTSRELDAVLAAADDEILGYVRANTDPEAALTAVLAAEDGNADFAPARSLPGSVRGRNTKAGRVKNRQRRALSPVGARRRKRWAAVGVIAGLWLGILAAVGSVLAGSIGSMPLATVLLLLFAALTVTSVIAAQRLSIAARHPRLRRLAARPWRDGRDVLNTALRHLPEAFIVMPSKTLLAPDHIELVMSPADLTSLAEVIDLELVNSTAAEHYAAAVAAHAARRATDDPVEVSVVSDPAVPVGRYRLRRGQQRRSPAHAVTRIRPHRCDGPIDYARAEIGAAGAGLATLAEPAVSPSPLRLVTNGSVTETRMSGARAGRGWDAELQLPLEPTVSRVHAEFTFDGNQWWVTSRGLNGLVLNGTPVSGGQAIQPGDSIRWGRQDGALVSRVEIG
jgi:hypothetical protein